MGELDFALGQRVWIDGEVVVVSRYFDLSSLQIFDRMVSAVVAELELEGLPSQRDSRQLMPQTDSEDRLAAHQPADGIDCIRARLRITGAVREENSVGLERQHILRRSLRWDHCHLASFAAQLAQN